MSETLSVDLSKIQQIIESEWDDDKIRHQIGEYVIQIAAEQSKEIKLLLQTKPVAGSREIDRQNRSAAFARCCRGHM